jgi:hypothetical protein
MIEAQTLSEAAITEIRDAPDVDALERIRRDFVGDQDARIPVLLASAHPDHHHHIHDAVARVEAAFKDRLAALEKRRP